MDAVEDQNMEAIIDEHSTDDELEELNEMEGIAEFTIEEINNDDAEDVTMPVSLMPPLRPLSITPNTAKPPLQLNAGGNQNLLVLQNTINGLQSIKLLRRNLGLKLANNAANAQTIHAIQPKKIGIRRVIPKTITTSLSNKPAEHTVLRQKHDFSNNAQTLKEIQLKEAHPMGQNISQIGASTSNQKVLIGSPVIVNKDGQRQLIKVYRNPRALSKIPLAALTSTNITPNTTPQPVFVKKPNVQFVEGEFVPMPSTSKGHVHQIKVPGEGNGMKYIQIRNTPQMEESSASSGKLTMKNIIPSSAGSSTINPRANNLRHYTPEWVAPELDFGTNDIKPRKPCNCSKSWCLKMYCECFANGQFCYNCNCLNCFNNLEHEKDRQHAIKHCLERNPNAFRPKIGRDTEMGEIKRKHTKGCHCKRSGCLKNYCECFEAKVGCSTNCACTGCKNIVKSFEPVPSSALALMADESTRRMPVDVGILEEKGKLPYDMFSKGIITTTTKCLLELAKEGKRLRKGKEEIKQDLIRHYGKCLSDIIRYSSGRNLPMI